MNFQSLCMYLQELIHYILSFFFTRTKLKWSKELCEMEYTYSKDEYDRTRYKETSFQV